MPTYNPITIDALLKLLRLKCFNCDRLRIKQRIKEDYKVIFTLIKKGEVTLANEFMAIDMVRELKKMAKLQEKESKLKDSKEGKKEPKDKEQAKKKAE